MSEENNEVQQLEIVAPSVIESIERANVDMQIATAHKYPRSLTVAKRKMMELATLDEETAESCFYKLNRQGKGIEGPSIRLAEIAASSFGNLRFGARVVANDGKQITAQGFCHDLESNVMFTIEVKRRITGKDGRTYSDDMQVVTGNAACAIAARNSVFKVVPFAFVKPVFLAAKKTAVGDITTLADRRTKMLAKFAAFGVNEKRVCAAVSKAGVDEIGLAELEDLIGIHNAIRDGETSVDEAFPAEPKPIVFGEAGIPTPGDDKKQRGRTKKGVNPANAVGPTGPTGVPAPERATPLQTLRALMTATGVVEKDLLVYLFGQNLINQGDTLERLAEEKLNDIVNSWLSIAPEIKNGESS